LAFNGRSLAELPERLGGLLTRAGGGSVLLKIRRGDKDAIDGSLGRLVDDKTEMTERLDLIQTLGEVRSRIALPTILKLFDSANDEKLESALLIALQNYSDADIGQRIVSRFDSLLPESQSNAVAALTMRKSWTMNLLDEVATGKVAPEAISKGNVRRMMVHGDTAINSLVAKHWPELKPASSQELQLKIANYFEQLNGKPGDPYAGRVLFKQNCGKCHQLFGDGGNIGPDLTAFNRDDTLSMLNSVVDPSAEIREGFENFTVLTDDGRVVTGFIADQDSQVLVLRNAEGQSISIEQEAIEDKKANEKSVMPEGLLDGLSESQVSDLFSFLRSSQPLNR
jgi:putative heme-binding domain-containing protein